MLTSRYLKHKLTVCVLYMVFCLLSTTNYAQKNEFKIHTIAFYNLENLFDTINAPNVFDEYSPIMELKTKRSSAYQQKIKHMAYAISEIGKAHTGNAPAMIGICEVENRNVLEDLVATQILADKNYGIIHYDSPDARGIDVALLYRKHLFTPLYSKTYPLQLYDTKTQKPIKTRDQLVVSGQLDGELLHLIVNHWPSRRGGVTRSKFKRMKAARLNKYIIDSLQLAAPYAKILSLGDFNDNPIDTSIKHILETENKRQNLNLKALYNPFEELYRNGLGTTAYRDTWSLFDQILLSKPLLEKTYTSYRYYQSGIFNPNFLITALGKYKGYPFRSWNKSGFTKGYSDHFPVYVHLIKKIN